VYTHSTTAAAAAAAAAVVLIFVCLVVGHAVVLSMLKCHMHAVHCDHVE
jgi:hypothetical protein